MMLNDVVVSIVWTGPRYTVSKLSDGAAIQWRNYYIFILLCNAMITITLVEWIVNLYPLDISIQLSYNWDQIND